MNELVVGCVAGAALLGTAAAGCDSSSSGVYDPSQFGGSANVGGGLPGGGLGVGEACDDDGECRPGLACDGTCQPAGTTAEGQPCIISGECAEGLFCGGGLCVPAGEGMAGDACTTDADCEKGFRCGIEGLSARCVPEGMVDVGGACNLATDCYGGLACIEGACAVPPPGLPPFGLPWDGVDCEEPSTPVEALFYVPRDGDGRDFFSLPFPNDIRRTPSGLDLSGFPTPGAGLLGFDPVQRYLDAIANRDGFGMYSGVFLRFSGEVDLDSFDGNVQLVDLTTGSPLNRLFYAYSIGRSNYICHNRVHLSRGTDATWEPGHTYAAILYDGITDASGGTVAKSADLTAILGATMPSEGAVAAHYDDYASLRQWLTDNTVDPNTILHASVFTVGDPRAPFEDAVATADNLAAPAVADWTLCDGQATSPCSDAVCGAPDAAYHELHALVSLPVFQQGTSPYLQPADGGALTATVQRTEPVCLTVTVPTGAAPANGFSTVVYAHGTGGVATGHITNGIAKALAEGVDDGQGSTVAMATVGITQVMHGSRRNGSTMDPQDLFFNFQNPAAALGNPQQGALDQIALRTLVPTIDFDTASSPTGMAFALSGQVAFWGHSQGATLGALATPYGDWAGVVFSGQGASLRHSLVTKTSPVDIAGAVAFVLGDFDGSGQLRGGSRNPALAILQTHIDGADPVNYARLLATAPPAGETARHVFQLFGQSDTYTPAAVQKIYAQVAGLGLADHDASVSTPEDFGLTTLPLPVSGNLDVGGPITGVVRQYSPPSGQDGHFVAFDVATAQADALRFLAGAAAGGVPQVGP